jgi:hypothetical protein
VTTNKQHQSHHITINLSLAILKSSLMATSSNNSSNNNHQRQQQQSQEKFSPSPLIQFKEHHLTFAPTVATSTAVDSSYSAQQQLPPPSSIFYRTIHDSRSINFTIFTHINPSLLPQCQVPSSSATTTGTTITTSKRIQMQLFESIPWDFKIDWWTAKYQIYHLYDTINTSPPPDSSSSIPWQSLLRSSTNEILDISYSDHSCQTHHHLHKRIRDDSMSVDGIFSHTTYSSSSVCTPTFSITIDLDCSNSFFYTMNGRKSFRKSSILPPDTNYGISIPSAILYIVGDSSHTHATDHNESNTITTCPAIIGEESIGSFYATRSFLLASPIPDKTMPFNVLTIVSSQLYNIYNIN